MSADREGWNLTDWIAYWRSEAERLQQERYAAQLDLNTAHADLEIVTGHRDALRERVTQLETALRAMVDRGGTAHRFREDGTCAECWRPDCEIAIARDALDVPEQEQP